MRVIIFATALLVGCAAKAPEIVVVAPIPEPVEIVQPTVKAAVVPSVPAVIAAANKARTDATGYVAWKASKPENIATLTTLTRSLNSAVAKLHDHPKPADVLAARAAVDALRSFLIHKDD